MQNTFWGCHFTQEHVAGLRFNERIQTVDLAVLMVSALIAVFADGFLC